MTLKRFFYSPRWLVATTDSHVWRFGVGCSIIFDPMTTLAIRVLCINRVTFFDPFRIVLVIFILGIALFGKVASFLGTFVVKLIGFLKPFLPRSER